jgi:hypothetical protein
LYFFAEIFYQLSLWGIGSKQFQGIDFQGMGYPFHHVGGGELFTGLDAGNVIRRTVDFFRQFLLREAELFAPVPHICRKDRSDIGHTLFLE